MSATPSIMLALCRDMQAHLSAPDAEEALRAATWIVYRQQSVLEEVEAEVAKQSAAGVIYPVAALRAGQAPEPFQLRVRIDIYTDPVLRPGNPAASDIAEAVVRRLDRWMPADGMHSADRVAVVSAALAPDAGYFVWQVELKTTRYISP